MTKPITPFPLRMPAEMKDWLRDKADKNFRSMNNEIIAMLKEQQQKEEEIEKAA